MKSKGINEWTNFFGNGNTSGISTEEVIFPPQDTPSW